MQEKISSAFRTFMDKAAQHRKGLIVALCVIIIAFAACVMVCKCAGSAGKVPAVAQTQNTSQADRETEAEADTRGVAREETMSGDYVDDGNVDTAASADIPASGSASAPEEGESGQGYSSSGSAGNTPSQETPIKTWVVDYAQVWVEGAAAYDEQLPVYSQTEESICNICGAEITGIEAAHGKVHMLAGEGSGHHTEVISTIVGYSTVHHDATGHYKMVENGGHWE
jgi:hypothetical protein